MNPNPLVDIFTLKAVKPYKERRGSDTNWKGMDVA